MKRLLDVVKPSIVVITTIGSIPSRAAFFDNPKAFSRELSRLVRELPSTGFAILNADDEEVVKLKESIRAQVIGYGFSKKSDLILSNFSEILTEEGSQMTLKLEYGGSMIPLRLGNAVGRGEACALAAAACCGMVFGLNMVKISEALQKFVPPGGRCRVIAGLMPPLFATCSSR